MSCFKGFYWFLASLAPFGSISQPVWLVFTRRVLSHGPSSTSFARRHQISMIWKRFQAPKPPNRASIAVHAFSVSSFRLLWPLSVMYLPTRSSSFGMLEQAPKSSSQCSTGHSSLYSAICTSNFSISALSSLLYLKREKFVSF